MNGLDLLRWVLLVIGVAILVGIYLAGQRSFRARRRARRAERASLAEVQAAEDEDRLGGTGQESEPASEFDRELEDLGHSISLEEGRSVRPTRREDAGGGAARPATEAGATADPAAADTAAGGGQPTKLVALFVMAREGHTFRGVDIRAAAQAAGLEYGDMRIFHCRHAQDPQRRSVFSMANVVEPGWFELETMDALETPGLALFMQRPGPMSGSEAFDTMVAAARVLQSRLQGELRDASRSVLGQQTIEHLRDEIREFERRQQSAVRSAR